MARISLREYEAYHPGVSRYVAFCLAAGWQPFEPARPDLFIIYIESWCAALISDGLAADTIRHYMHGARWTVLRAYDIHADPIPKHIWDAALTNARHEAKKTHHAAAPFDLDALVASYDWLPAPEYFTILLAILFLLRSSEYVQPGTSAAKALHRPIQAAGTYILRRKDGAEELHIIIPSSKTDPTGKGSCHGREATGVPATCPVLNYRRMLAALPAHTRSGQLCKASDGTPMTYDTVNKLVKHLHSRTGRSTDNISSHSLRKAGAERLWLATKDVILVMREGRWRTMASMRPYIGLDTAAAAGVSAGMAEARTHDGVRV